MDALSSHGYVLKNHLPEMVQHTPWSSVMRFTTEAGDVYLKHMPKALALEAPITNVLYHQFHASVPYVIAYDNELSCFLMKDAGNSLRALLKKEFNAIWLCRAIDQFTLIQLAVSDHLAVFLKMGVPDWRLNQLPNLCEQLFSQKAILRADGVSDAEINELIAQLPTISRLCQQLSTYAIKPSIVQCDFHDNNILIDTTSNKLTFIDLGEVVISHPFFSLIGCLRQAVFHHGLKEESDAYQQMMDSCLRNYRTVESKERLLEAFAIARILWFVYEAAAQYRLRMACDEAEFLAFQRHGKLRTALMWFLSAVMAKS